MAKKIFMSFFFIAIVLMAVFFILLPFKTETLRSIATGSMILSSFFFVLTILLGICIFLFRCLFQLSSVPAYMGSITVASIILLSFLHSIVYTKIMDQRQESSMLFLTENALDNLHQKLMGYATDHGGHLPIASKWCDLLFSDSPFMLQTIYSQYPCNVAFNSNLSNLNLYTIPGNTVLLFTANGDFNLSGGYDLMKTHQPEEEQYAYLCLVNGRILRCRLSDGTLLEIRPPNNEALWIKSEDDKSTIAWEP